jgi:hypothetical protein
MSTLQDDDQASQKTTRRDFLIRAAGVALVSALRQWHSHRAKERGQLIPANVLRTLGAPLAKLVAGYST